MKNSDKMTNRKALDYVLENCDLPSEVSEKLSAMLVALDKKSVALASLLQTRLRTRN